MADNSYAQLIDDFDAGIQVLEGETLTEYIKRMGGVDYNAHGGSVGIEVLFKKKDGGRIGLQTGGTSYDPRASVQDYANALQSVSGGTTYQQQADATRYARQQASQMLDDAMKSASTGGSLQGIYDTFFKNKNISGISNRTFTPGGSGTMMMYSPKDRNKMLDAMSNQMLNTTSYAAPDPFKKRMDELEKIKAENQRLVNEYMQNNPPLTGLITGPMGGTSPSPGSPIHEDQTLLSQLTKLTPEQATSFDSFDQLSDIDQYNLAQAYPDLQSQLRDSSYVSPSGALDKQQIFERIYGLKDGGRVGLENGGTSNWWDGLEGEALSIYNSMSAYNAPDSEIQAKLQEQNLWSPDGTPDSGNTGQVTGIINQNIGGDNYSPYKFDPNKVRTDYRPNYEYRQHVDYNPEWSSTMNQKQFDMNQNYYNEPAPSAMNRKLSSLMNFIPGIGGVKRGMEFLGNTFKGIMPVNQRSIMENQLRGSGIYTDDIGRLTVGPDGQYNTPEGIMAGYNASRMDPNKENNAWDRRTGNITDSLVDKTSLTAKQIKDIVSEIENTGTYSGTLTDEELGVKNLFSNLVNVNLNKYMFTKNKKKADDIAAFELENKKIAKANKISQEQAAAVQQAIEKERGTKGSSDYGNPGGTSGAMTEGNVGTYCFDPSTCIQMADGSTKEIKNIQLGDDTKGGEVTGVFQFKATDEIHDYKGVTVAGSHYVKEDGRFIMVQDSPLSVKIDKIPVVYSLDTTGRRIFINDIEFADYNGDGVAKTFLTNANVDLTGFNKEVLRQVEHRLI